MERKRKKWLDANIPDLAGKAILVTGATGGLGCEAALSLAYRHARVIMACRNPAKAKLAEEAIKREVPLADLSALFYDQADLASIRHLGEEVKGIPFDAAILNAGIYYPPKGQEASSEPSLTFRTNAIGTYAVFRALAASHPHARFVFVNSIANSAPAHGDFSPYFTKGDIPARKAYAVSKRAIMIIFEAAFQKGADVCLTHPGIAKTNIIGPEAPLLKRLGNGFLYLFAHEPWKASLGMVAAAAGAVPSGSYLTPRGPFHLSGYPKRAHLSAKRLQGPGEEALLALLDGFVERDAAGFQGKKIF